MKSVNSSLDIILNDAGEIIHALGNKLEMLSGKTVLVAGANGVVGSYFVNTIAVINKRKYTKKPITCICVTRHKVTKTLRLGHLLGQSNIHFVTADITQQLEVSLPPDYIIHSASYASPKSYLAKPIETMEANSIGTKHLLDLAHKNSAKMLFISTGSVYGDARKGEGPFTEDHCGYVSPLDTRAVYSESKRFGETLCSVYAARFSVQVTIARLSNMYGPGFSLDDGRAIPDFFNQAFSSNTIIINGDPRGTRAYLYIADAIVGMWQVLLNGKKGEVYNIASEKSLTIKQIVKKISSLFPGCKVLPREDKTKTYLSGSPVHAVISNGKLMHGFGWQEEVSLDEGLKRLYRWYRAKQD